MEMSQITWVVGVDLHGVLPRVLVLDYAASDPAAVRVECNGGRWTVARKRLVDALDPAGVAGGGGDEGVAGVQLVRLPGMCGCHLLLKLRTPQGYWLMAVRADVLAGFLVATYQACPVGQEQQLVDAALDGQLELIAATDQARRAGDGGAQ